MASQNITWTGCWVRLTIPPPMSTRVGYWTNTRTFWELNSAATVKSFSSLKIVHLNSPLFTRANNARDLIEMCDSSMDGWTMKIQKTSDVCGSSILRVYGNDCSAHFVGGYITWKLKGFLWKFQMIYRKHWREKTPKWGKLQLKLGVDRVELRSNIYYTHCTF